MGNEGAVLLTLYTSLFASPITQTQLRLAHRDDLVSEIAFNGEDDHLTPTLSETLSYPTDLSKEDRTDAV